MMAAGAGRCFAAGWWQQTRGEEGALEPVWWLLPQVC